MNIAIAYPAFIGSFREYFPNIEIYSPGKRYDLVIFSGGDDINPKIYGENNLYSDFDENRDRIETDILRSVLNFRYSPYILGVCRGHQLINALLGNKLIQDIGKQLGKGHPGFHEITPLIGTIAQTFFKTEKGIFVNSMHHQGIHISNFYNSNGNMRVTGHYNGIAEFIEGPKILTLQSHPEFSRNAEFFEWVKNIVSSGSSFYQNSPDIVVENPNQNDFGEIKKTRKSKKSSIATASIDYASNDSSTTLPSYQAYKIDLSEETKERFEKAKEDFIRRLKIPPKENAEPLVEFETKDEHELRIFKEKSEQVDLEYKRASDELEEEINEQRKKELFEQLDTYIEEENDLDYPTFDNFDEENKENDSDES